MQKIVGGSSPWHPPVFNLIYVWSLDDSMKGARLCGQFDVHPFHLRAFHPQTTRSSHLFPPSQSPYLFSTCSSSSSFLYPLLSSPSCNFCDFSFFSWTGNLLAFPFFLLFMQISFRGTVSFIFLNLLIIYKKCNSISIWLFDICSHQDRNLIF